MWWLVLSTGHNLESPGGKIINEGRSTLVCPVRMSVRGYLVKLTDMGGCSLLWGVPYPRHMSGQASN